MEHPGVDDWTRVDPVFNEGTTVEGRVALQLQVMSDRVARRMSLATNALWLALPTLAITLLLKYRLDPNRYVLSPEQHAPAAVLPALVATASLALLALLLRVCVALRRRRWTVAQVRLVALRGAAVAVLATEAALTVLPNLAVLVQPCMYGDGSASLVRWASAGRQALAFAFIALKGTEIRCLLLCDPRESHLGVLGVFRHCLPPAAVARVARALERRAAAALHITPPQPPSASTADSAASPTPEEGPPADGDKDQRCTCTGRYDTPSSHACSSSGSHAGHPAGGAGGQRHERAGRVHVRADSGSALTGGCGPVAPDSREGLRRCDSDRERSSCGTGGSESGGEDGGGGGGARPYGQEEVPVLALPEPLLLWAWHIWLLAAVAVGLILAYAAFRKPFAQFSDAGRSCTPWEDSCSCGRATLTCRWSSAVAVNISIAAVALYGTLVALLAVDIWRGRRRLLQRLYMPNRHTHALLAISRRFSLTSVAVFILTSVASNLPEWQSDTAEVLGASGGPRGGGLATPRACATYAGLLFGSPLTNAVMAAVSAVELALVWPKLATECKRPMHEHLQRFVWVDADLPAAKEARDRSALPHDTSQVPMFSMQRAVNLFFWMNLAYQLSSAPHLRDGTMDPAVAAALRHSHRPAMALFGLKRLRFFWEHRSDAKATVAWGRSAIVISWRGTSTLTNAKMDLHLSRTPLPGVPRDALPKPLPAAADSCTPCSLLGTLRRSVPLGHPMVHSGFWNTYQSSGVAQRLLMHVFSLLESGEVDREECTVYICGHSLGGALAVLNSLDIAAGCGLRTGQVVVYTIGCPRVGDRAFARHADAAVPDTWHIINGRDVVTQWGKLAGCYKSTGQRVIVNQFEQLIVRPSFFEYIIHRLGGRSHLSEHYPGKYLERIALAIARTRNLCRDRRESCRIARLLLPALTPRAPSGHSAASAGGSPGGADGTSSLRADGAVRGCDRGSGHSSASGAGGGQGSGSCRGRQQVESVGSDVHVWSSVCASSGAGSAPASPVAFGDVVDAFCGAEDDGNESDHTAVASVIVAIDAEGHTAAGSAQPGGGSCGGTLRGSSSEASESHSSSDLPSVFVNIDPPPSAESPDVCPRHSPHPEPAASPATSATTPHGAAAGHIFPEVLPEPCCAPRAAQHSSHSTGRVSSGSGKGRKAPIAPRCVPCGGARLLYADDAHDDAHDTATAASANREAPGDGAPCSLMPHGSTHATASGRHESHDQCQLAAGACGNPQGRRETQERVCCACCEPQGGAGVERACEQEGAGDRPQAFEAVAQRMLDHRA